MSIVQLARRVRRCLFLVSYLFLAGMSHADEKERSEVTSRLLEEVFTTATKKGEQESTQEVAGALSVLGGAKLDALHVNDIEDLGYVMPNVAFDSIGTGKGIANFSIRGMGVAGSIPSIDPTVGVFVDGMYLGVNYGVVMDFLDLATVEVLRGPQGLLFGRKRNRWSGIAPVASTVR